MRPHRVLFAAFSGTLALALAFVPSASGADSPAATWSIQQSANPAGALYAALGAVSCPARGSGFCMAVGNWSTPSGPDVPLAEMTDGNGWTLTQPHAPRGARQSELSGVSCFDRDHCIAVGIVIRPTGTVRALVERWNGARWSIMKTPVLPRSSWSELVSVSCAAARDCIAVGGYIPNAIDAQERPLAEHLTHSRWRIDHVPNPRAENGSGLTGVSCPFAPECEAVGEYVFADVDQQILAFGRSSFGWARQHQPGPNQSELTSEGSVSCFRRSRCTGVGSWVDRQGRTRALAERWNGSMWIRQHVPNPSGFAVSQLLGVHCVGPDRCVGVGSWSDGFNGIPSHSLAERWNGNGHFWRIESTPDPPGATLTSLNAVDCESGTCVAVGSSYDGSMTSTLVEIRST